MVFSQVFLFALIINFTIICLNTVLKTKFVLKYAMYISVLIMVNYYEIK